MHERLVGPVALHGAAYQLAMAARQIGKVVIPAQRGKHGVAQVDMVVLAGAVAQRAQFEFLAHVEFEQGLVLQDLRQRRLGIKLLQLVQASLPDTGRFLGRVDLDHAP